MPIFNVIALCIFIICLIYYVILAGISFYAKLNVTIHKEKVSIPTVKITYVITSLIAFYAVFFIIHKLLHTHSFYNVYIVFSGLYLFVSLSKMIPYKVFIINRKGIILINPQLRFRNFLFNPVFTWDNINILKIVNNGDYFEFHIINKYIDKIVLSLPYQEYYQIKPYLQRKTH